MTVDILAPRQVAHLLGLEVGRVYEFLRTGRLHGRRQPNGTWRIPAAAVARLRAELAADHRLLTADTVHAIRTAHQAWGSTPHQLAATFGLPIRTIHRVLRAGEPQHAAHGQPFPVPPRDLSPLEARLYAILAAHAGTAVAARDLQQQLWGAATRATAAYLALYVRRLQETLATDPTTPQTIRRRRGRHGTRYELASTPVGQARVIPLRSHTVTTGP